MERLEKLAWHWRLWSELHICMEDRRGCSHAWGITLYLVLKISLLQMNILVNRATIKRTRHSTRTALNQMSETIDDVTLVCDVTCKEESSDWSIAPLVCTEVYDVTLL